MNLVIWFFATVITLALSSPTPKALLGDYNEFAALIPTESIRQLSETYWTNGDEEFIAQIEYLDGPEWNIIKTKLDAYDIVQQLKTTLSNGGIEVSMILENINAVLKGNAPPNTIGKREKRSINTFIQDVDALWPGTEIEILANIKQVTSPEFKVLWDQIANEDAHMVYMAILVIPEVLALRSDLDAMGVDTELYVGRLANFFGWMHHPQA